MSSSSSSSTPPAATTSTSTSTGAATSSSTVKQLTQTAVSSEEMNKFKRTPLDYYKDLTCNGLVKAVLCEPYGSRVEVSLYGGQVMSWKNNKGQELLFVSKKAIFNRPPNAIRGGIPVCFPQFSTYGPMQRHGFARNRMWNVDTDPPPLPKSNEFFYRSYIDLILKPKLLKEQEEEEDFLLLKREKEKEDDEDEEEEQKQKQTEEDNLKSWDNHRYECRLRVSLTPDGDLVLIVRIKNVNTNGESFSFTFAFHNYFPLSDIEEIRIEGLETMHYCDNLKNKERHTEQTDALTFESAVDRVYLDTPKKIAVIDHHHSRTIVIRKEGLPDTCVWNPWGKESGWNYPWEKKAKVEVIEDLEKDEFIRMLCVGSAAVQTPIKLRPGEEWTAWQWLSAARSSYHSGELNPQMAK